MWSITSIPLASDYMGFGKRTLASHVISGDAEIPTGSILRDHDTNIWVIKGGINYHFNWGAAPKMSACRGRPSQRHSNGLQRGVRSKSVERSQPITRQNKSRTGQRCAHPGPT